MTTSYGTNQHPYGLLEAFALNALEPWEEGAVAAHIDLCPGCAAIAEQHLLTAQAMAHVVAQEEPPERLRARILDSVSSPAPAVPSVSVSVPRRRPAGSWSRVSSVVSSRWVRLLTPATAVLAVALIAVMVGLNVQMAGDMDEMQSENTQLRQQMERNLATTTALARSSEAVSQMRGSLQQWQQTSYALAQPGNQTLVMSPARPSVDSKGVLVISEDGAEGVLMVSGLDAPQPGSVYHVWLTHGGQRYWVGEMDVDERGWGAMQLRPADPLNNYDSIQLSQGIGVAVALATPAGSVERARATAGMVGDMVLVAPLR